MLAVCGAVLILMSIFAITTCPGWSGMISLFRSLGLLRSGGDDFNLSFDWRHSTRNNLAL